MEPSFWHERWQQGQIGFHQPDVHPALLRDWPGLAVPSSARVLVPLCGRSLDMAWLAHQGHHVVGIELSPIAVAGFFEHEGLSAVTSSRGPFTLHAAPGYELLEGDFFDTSVANVGAIGAWYDRAALVALPPTMRRHYARHLATLLPAGSPGLLVTHDYAQERMAGPPFSVPVGEVEALFSTNFSITRLERRDVLPGNARFRERGLDRFMETVFRLDRR